MCPNKMKCVCTSWCVGHRENKVILQQDITDHCLPTRIHFSLQIFFQTWFLPKKEIDNRPYIIYMGCLAWFLCVLFFIIGMLDTSDFLLFVRISLHALLNNQRLLKVCSTISCKLINQDMKCLKNQLTNFSKNVT